MLKKKNAQGLSITTIIIAVVGIIVLVVLIALFTGKLGGFSKSLEEESAIKCLNVCGALNMVEGAAAPAGGPPTACVAGETKVSDKCCCKPKA